MGQSAPVLRAFSWEAMWKYCCNAQHLKSRCCEICEVEYETDMIPLESDSDMEIEVMGCCAARNIK